jgi:type IV pilus assembly protein PilA
MKKNNKGFTLAELLIVVAIIAVLVAIAIPVFTTQLEKSRETTDMANLRSAYGAATVYGMTESVADSLMYYDPKTDGAIVSSPANTKLGQGTKADGKADTTQLAGGQIEYSTGTDAKGKDIAIQYSNGVVNKISFAG